MIAGGVTKHEPSRRLALVTSSRHVPGWKEVDPTTTVPEPPPQATGSRPPVRVRGSARAGGGCRSLDQIKQDESRGSYTEVNPSSGAGGAYQFLPSTWQANGGQGLPQNASPAEQDAIAAKVYAEQGTRPWAASGC